VLADLRRFAAAAVAENASRRRHLRESLVSIPGLDGAPLHRPTMATDAN